ncbi:transmembrane glycoprotein NMB isoform X4 [Bubalus kerabau]|uniref:transmembrane glycoprotein NMB isoform X4 n=1 Tax=Bubalus carabanensis TaxID=3119969 RepID=UPI00244E867D|nr:transmembrane glycoprotein NMB isoform X4 [Bubalus carabanensis]
MECLYCFLGFLLLAARLPLDAAKRFHDVLSNERPSGYMREHNQLSGWSSDENDWNEKLYPVWKRGDSRWKSSWKGGCVQAVLTSDSPALVGSTITFAVNLVFPRCQKEDASGNIVYEKNCRNDTGASPDPYVYNWTAWTEDSDWGNDTSEGHHNVFPDGKPFPRPWKKNFVYVFHTLGQYFQKLGQCSVTISINTANVSLGPQIMEVTVYRRHRRAYVPIAKVKDVYVVTVTAGDSALELRETPDESCHITRYGYFKATITIIEGILEVNIIQVTDVPMPGPQPDNSLVDFVVTCQGSIPTEVCTIISDPSCQITQSPVCDPVAMELGDTCLLTVRRAFSGSGTYCMNLTLADDASLALTSTLVSINSRNSASLLRMANGILVSLGCLAILVTVIAFLMYKKHKEYKPIENSPGIVIRGKGLNVFLNHAKTLFFPGNQEKDPLLKNQPGIL